MGDYADLIERAKGGDTAADWALIATAAGGALDCQRALLDALLADPDSHNLGAMLRVEMLARFVAARGTENDWLRLGHILWTIAMDAEAASAPVPLVGKYVVEAFEIMRDLADLGSVKAHEALTVFQPHFPWAWDLVDGCHRPDHDRPTKGSDLPGLTGVYAMLWSGSDVTACDTAPPVPMPPPPPPPPEPLTVWERFSARMGDGAWSVRFWCIDRAWDLRFAWWRLTDWVSIKFGREGF